ncbi:hypothetical protein CBS147310_6837 [Penicillium roqueforti]|nr:hypothetical protein CBS147310_6837 [Penicillium roqueforti]
MTESVYEWRDGLSYAKLCSRGTNTGQMFQNPLKSLYLLRPSFEVTEYLDSGGMTVAHCPLKRSPATIILGFEIRSQFSECLDSRNMTVHCRVLKRSPAIIILGFEIRS